MTSTDEVFGTYTVDEAKLFLRAAENDPLYPAFVFLILYGLRRGEVLGLRRCDLDFTGSVLHVRQQVQQLQGQLHIGPVKTEAGERDLPLVGVIGEAFVDWQQRQGDLSHQVDRANKPETLVFRTSTGRPIQPRNLMRSFRRICMQQGIRIVRIHDLRHTTATLLKDLGVADRDIQLILGTLTCR
ncbi:site-specific integrase [Kibdelosporangium aridum]|uniref:site-specific integrase n=1 Tax=Kibdelosporangium aridum TaxID=2030 RepID=UPI0035ECEEA2